MEKKSSIKLAEKQKALEQKELSKKKLEDDQNDRVKFASTMMRQVVGGNGGSFLDLTNNNSNVSKLHPNVF